ncbi:tyrosine-type recombinase/integrase [Micromonospora sp. NPDC047548]|uniref:tyrosine-type recombinase/integrase n=1 Tax=Micromonospora sp. NPDC047548 TaxID=3155624 RepID=UPI0033D704C6
MAQEKEQETAAQLWREGDWVFTQPDGKPLDPRADHDAWEALLKEANVRDARHTAATMLLVLGLPTRAVMEVMGWSQMAMTTRYQHLAPQLIDGIAGQVAGLLWKAD